MNLAFSLSNLQLIPGLKGKCPNTKKKRREVLKTEEAMVFVFVILSTILSYD